MPNRRFPPLWSVEEQPACFVVRDHNGQTLAYIHFEHEPGRRSAAKLLGREGEKNCGEYCEVAFTPPARRLVVRSRHGLIPLFCGDENGMVGAQELSKFIGIISLPHPTPAEAHIESHTAFSRLSHHFPAPPPITVTSTIPPKADIAERDEDVR